MVKNAMVMPWPDSPRARRAAKVPSPFSDRELYPFQGDGVVRIQLKRLGGGKMASVVTGIPLDEDALKDLARTLKQKCGVGGSVKDFNIEIQGDKRNILKAELEKKGYTVKLAGG